MGWYKTILIVIAYGGLVQFINWSFTSLKLDENLLDILPFIISNIIAILTILTIVVISMQRRRRML